MTNAVTAVGEPAPTFALESNSGTVTLADYRGKPVVLYFYPEAFTGGCTLEACGLRDDFPVISGHDAVVLGVSVDGLDRLDEFKKEHSLPFTLLSDPDGAVAGRYGSYGITRADGSILNQARRTTFIIDPNGVIAEVFDPVVPATHAEQVVAALERLTAT